MRPNPFEGLEALRALRARQDREIAQLHQQLLDRGDDGLTIDEAELSALDELMALVPASPPLTVASGSSTSPTAAFARC